MRVEAVALQDFVHGNLHGQRNKLVTLNESLALELERAGLVRITTAPPEGADAGKALAAGTDTPSSALPAAQASPKKTSSKLKIGLPKAPTTDT
jgi:hypothetical protein